MESKKPMYLGSWKGRIIRAISIDGARTWAEIRDITGLSPKSLNQTLSELMHAKVLEKQTKGEKTAYKVSYNLYKEYTEYYKEESTTPQKKVAVKPEVQTKIHQWIDQWKDLNNLDIDLGAGHFFLQGMQLDEFSKKIISQQAQKEVLVVNPFVEPVDLSKTLLESAKRGVDTTLITRRTSDDHRKKESIDKFHEALKAAGANLIYKLNVHAKIIVADKAVAIVSSMNFNPTSSAGQSWEAGLVSIKDTVVESVLEKIIELQELVA
jgi:predicted transcriptional regulator